MWTYYFGFFKYIIAIYSFAFPTLSLSLRLFKNIFPVSRDNYKKMTLTDITLIVTNYFGFWYIKTFHKLWFEIL